jgi:hypothetical protein
MGFGPLKDNTVQDYEDEVLLHVNYRKDCWFILDLTVGQDGY